jgi:hypothetical protein
MPFYGLDGDKVGRVIEGMFVRGEVDSLRKFSGAVVAALKCLADSVAEQGGDVILAGGDSLLFEGDFDDRSCQALLDRFAELTGCTASIGSGVSIRDAYLALKLAKANGGGQLCRYGDGG